MKAARYSWIALLAITAARAGDDAPAQVNPPPPPPKEEGSGDKPPGGPRGQRGEGRGEGFRKMMETWKKADTNGDTFISPEEFAAMERIAQLTPEKRDELFKRFDKNSDGKIGQDELKPRQNPGPPGSGGDGPPRIPLEEADTNPKDGKIDFEEFKTLKFVQRLPEDRQQNMFKRMDTDGDGFLTPTDRPPRDRDGRGGGGGGRGRGGLLELIKDHDKDANGSLNFEEFRQIPWIAKDGEDEQERRFEEFDKNKDLKLDAADAPPPQEKRERPKDEEKKAEAS